MQLSSKPCVIMALVPILFAIFEDKLGRYTTALRCMGCCWKTSWRITVEYSLSGV